MLGNREIERSFDSLGLGFRPQNFLRTFDFHGVQLEVLVDAFVRRWHVKLL